MSDINISVPGGKAKRLLTGGKYCPDNIVVTAEADHTVEDQIVDGSIKGVYENNRVSKVNAMRFYGLDGPEEFRSTSATMFGTGVFQYNTGIKKVYTPNCTEFYRGGLANCEKLEFVDCLLSASIWADAFSGSSKLATLVIRRTDKPCPLSNTAFFSGTPFASGGSGGKVYVPSALIEGYKTATNWSVLYGYGTCEFVALEGSEYE